MWRKIGKQDADVYNLATNGRLAKVLENVVKYDEYEITRKEEDEKRK